MRIKFGKDEKHGLMKLIVHDYKLQLMRNKKWELILGQTENLKMVAFYLKFSRDS